jgi:hypothetical protein
MRSHNQQRQARSNLLVSRFTRADSTAALADRAPLPSVARKSPWTVALTPRRDVTSAERARPRCLGASPRANPSTSILKKVLRRRSRKACLD